ncbi:FAST kinase domain-containing protein 4 isoform X2 [Anastrepha obliqua]|uniref:FAST kinase domain-containing protein 4 isoform X2 n=1 Tax=Anastrepha obliqua TaxID=95512 RepID=UPI002409741D|nr:FAST kinase domain-containing protein 4 isoform X2 [Anastrepha obliqua]
MLGLQRIAGGVAAQLLRHMHYVAYSTSVREAGVAAAAVATPKHGNISTPTSEEKVVSASDNDTPDVNTNKIQKSSLVAAAFESLKEDTSTTDASAGGASANGKPKVSESKGSNNLDNRILKAKTVNGLLSVSESNGPLSLLGVAGDDEAAKLIASISLPQMVKVMSTLAQRKRRSTPLLRSLAFNISSATEQLDLKQSADILFAMASLNFQDSVLAAKICADIQAVLPKNTEKSAVVGSILTSLGIMKYRDLDIMEALTQWTLKNSEICRPQDISALFITSAILNFKSANIDDIRQKLATSIVSADFQKSNDWLNHVWSLAMLGLLNNEQLNTVLSAEFIGKLEKERNGLSPTSKMKLLNLNGYAQLLTSDYKGSLLPEDSTMYDVPLTHAKSKQILVNGMLDALKSLLPASNHLKTLHDSKMGFLIDALCLFDNKRNPLPVDKENPNAIKVALMVVDFHDICHGTHRSASGITNLSFELLEKSGYKVIPVPYNEFNTSDKLLKRVQYLEAKFKAIISQKT